MGITIRELIQGSDDENRKGRDLTVWDRLSTEVWEALPGQTGGAADMHRDNMDPPLSGTDLQALLSRLLAPAEIDALPPALRTRLPEWPVGTMFESADYPGCDWTLRGYGLVTGEARVRDLPCALMEPRGGRSEYVPIEALHGDAWTKIVRVSAPGFVCALYGCDRQRVDGSRFCASDTAEIRAEMAGSWHIFASEQRPEQIEPLSPADDVRTAPEGGMRAPMPVDIGDAAILLRAREADPVPVARPMPESREAQLEAALRDVLAVVGEPDTEDERWTVARARKLVPGLPGDLCRVTAARLREHAAGWIEIAAERDRAVAS